LNNVYSLSEENKVRNIIQFYLRSDGSGGKKT
jgi:hypothetical protein